MKSILTKSRVATLMAILFAGCSNSDITAVKKMAVSEEPTHTNDTALSGRAACESEEWRKFKDDTNRTGVEYRCVLKEAPELMAAMRAHTLSETNRDFQNYYQSLNQRAEEFKQAPALQKAAAAQAQEKLAALEAEDDKANQKFAHEDPVSAMRRAAIRNEMGSVAGARSIAERSQQSANDAAANMERNLASLQHEKERFQRDEKSALAAIEKNYGSITKATEVFKWFVRDHDVVPAWSGVELTKQDGSVDRLDKNWTQTMQNVLRYRGKEHVHYALNIPVDLDVASQTPISESATIKANDPTQRSGDQGQACFDAKLKDFRNGMGEEAPVSNDMMNEWRSQCGHPQS